jgi:hypothetical protein
MLNKLKVEERAKTILQATGQKTELSPEALAVIAGLCEEINSTLLLDTQALIDKQLNAVQSTPTGRMKRPTLEEVIAHGLKIGLPKNECEKYFDHFESNGWKVGVAKAPMRLWTAALANWKRGWMDRNGTGPLAGIPTLREVVQYAQEKEPGSNRYAVSWFQYWVGKNWKRDGTVIDWKITYSKSYAQHRKENGL